MQKAAPVENVRSLHTYDRSRYTFAALSGIGFSLHLIL